MMQSESAMTSIPSCIACVSQRLFALYFEGSFPLSKVRSCQNFSPKIKVHLKLLLFKVGVCFEQNNVTPIFLYFEFSRILKHVKSEVLSPADEKNFISKRNFRSPFVCSSGGGGEALRRVREGAATIRTPLDLLGSGNMAETVRNVGSAMADIRILNNMDEDEVFAFSKKIAAPYDLVAQTKQMGRLPVVHFAAGGIVTPADAALMMQLGCAGVFLGSEIFDCSDPYRRVRGIVQAVRHYNDPDVLVEASSDLKASMAGLNLNDDRIEQFAREDS